MSTSVSVTFSPLLGAETSNGPLCYLLEVDEVNILLDCGWDDSFDVSALDPVRRVVEQGVDAVLISFPDINHLGALPYLVGKLNMNAMTYGTVPVHKMGQMYMYDAYMNRNGQEEFQTFDLDDVDMAFSTKRFHELNYAQTKELEFPDKDLIIQITPLAAGHMLGGTLWKIIVMKKDLDTQEIVYAVDFNHKRERHLDGSVIETIKNPNLFITDSRNAMLGAEKRSTRDSKFLTTIGRTLKNGGNVLIPVDPAGRVLELMMLLNDLWDQNVSKGFNQYGLVFLSHMSQSTHDFAKSQIEWMSSVVQKNFNATSSKKHPYALPWVEKLTDLNELWDLMRIRNPVCVMASPGTLESGMGQQLLMEWAGKPKNVIMFCQEENAESIAGKLMAIPTPPTLTFTLNQKVYLEGDELQAYLDEKERREAEERRRAEQKALEESSMKDISNVFEKAGAGEAGPGEGDGARVAKGKGRSKIRLASLYEMFPLQEENTPWDDYGEKITEDEYMHFEMHSAQAGTGQGNTNDEGNDVDADGDANMADGERAREEERPARYTQQEVTLNVNCLVDRIDLEGRADGQSIKNILKRVAPSKLVLVHGNIKAMAHLEKAIRADLKDTTLYRPKINETVNVTTDSNMYKIKLKDSMLANTQKVASKDFVLQYVDGVVNFPAGRDIPTLVAKKGALLAAQATTGRKGVLVGEVKLPDLKSLLEKEGFHVEFAGGVLVCNSSIMVKKVGNNQVTMEGLMGTDYYKIRGVLYDQFNLV